MILKEPKIQLAVLIPIYNVEKYLAECIDSVLGQIGIQAHLFLVDDKSTDGSLEVARAYAHQFPEQITLFEKPENGGIASTRNALLEMLEKSQKEFDYVYFLDSDDALCPEALKAVFSHPHFRPAQMICCQYQSWYASGELELQDVSPRGLLPRLTFSTLFLSDPGKLSVFLGNKLLRYDFIKGLRFDEKIRIAEDWEYTLRCLIPRLDEVLVLPIPLFKYRLRRSSITNSQKCFDIVDTLYLKKAHLFKELLTTQEYLLFQKRHFLSKKEWLYSREHTPNELSQGLDSVKALMHTLPWSMRLQKGLNVYLLPKSMLVKYVKHRQKIFQDFLKRRQQAQKDYFA